MKKYTRLSQVSFISQGKNISTFLKKIMIFPQTLLLLTCILGFSYTTYDMVTKFMSYGTVTKTVSETSLHFKLPKISVAIDLFLACDKLENETEKNFYSRMSLSQPSQILNNCTRLDDIIQEMSITTDDLQTPKLLGNTSLFSNFIENNVSTYIFDRKVVFQLKLNSNIYNRRDLQFSENYGNFFIDKIRLFQSATYFAGGVKLFQMTLKEKYSRQVGIWLSSSQLSLERPSVLQVRGLAEDNFDPSDVRLSQFQRLPAPYVTGCEDYGSLSKEGCYQRCVNSFYMKSFGMMSPYHLVSANSQTRIAFNITDVDGDFRRECSSRCERPACTESYYTPSYVYNFHEFWLTMVKEEVSETHYPKVTQIELILVTMGNFVFWFGVSLFSFPTQVIIPSIRWICFLRNECIKST